MFNPVAFRVFGWPIRWYGIAMASSLLVASYLAQKLLEARGRKADQVWDGVLWAALFGIVGARAGYVLTNLGDYAGHWLDVFKTYEGGLSIHGALALGLLGCWLYYRRTRLKLLEVMDAAAPGIAIGIMLVRFLGNFSNGDITAYAVSKGVVPWAMNFPYDEYHTAANMGEIITRHPAELYGGVVGLIVLLVCLWVWFKRYAPGTNMFAFILTYSVVRSLIEEPFRAVPHYLVDFTNTTYGFGGVTMTQWGSIPLIAISIWGIIYVNRRATGHEWDAPAPEPAAPVVVHKPRKKKKAAPAEGQRKKHKPFGN
jgi:phosphatidylglycerol:prolipoprotein diacylglycerol transferase